MKTVDFFSRGSNRYVRNTSAKVLLAGVLGCGAIASASAATIYVANTTPAWSGSYGTFAEGLAEAIQQAAFAPGTVIDIWIAKGRYEVPCGTDLPNNVNIYGGFNGNETSTGARAFSGNFPTYTTTLAEPTGVNCYLFGLVSQTKNTFDGLTLMAAGGITQSGGTLKVTSSTFTRDPSVNIGNVVIGGGILSMNSATLTVDKSQFVNGLASLGAGIGAVNAASVTVTNSTFDTNYAYGAGDYFRGGGALAFIGNLDMAYYGAPRQGNLTISNSKFLNNSVRDGAGGAISIDSADIVNITGSTFGSLDANGGNKTGSSYNGGAIVAGYTNKLTISTSQFYGNNSTIGGAIHTAAFNRSGSISITNSKFGQNVATEGGAIADKYQITGTDKTVTLTISGNTFNGNMASQGRVVSYDGLTELTINGKSTGNGKNTSVTIANINKALMNANSNNVNPSNGTSTWLPIDIYPSN